MIESLFIIVVVVVVKQPIAARNTEFMSQSINFNQQPSLLLSLFCIQHTSIQWGKRKWEEPYTRLSHENDNDHDHKQRRLKHEAEAKARGINDTP